MAAGFVAFTNCAIACSCKPRLLFKINPLQNIDQTEAILVGEILSVTQANVTVSPLEVLKGRISQPLIFENADRGVGCNYFGLNKAHVGDRHLLFYTYPGKVSVCSYSTPIEKSGDTLEILRKELKKTSKYGGIKLYTKR